jgi:hypothetical protein
MKLHFSNKSIARILRYFAPTCPLSHGKCRQFAASMVVS